jgi:transcriptional regulator with XRE-family HTH domain
MTTRGREAKHQALRERVYELLEQAQLNQSELAAKAGMSRAALSRILTGVRDVRTHHVLQLARALRLTAAALVEGTDAEGVIGKWVPRVQYNRSERDRVRASDALVAERAKSNAFAAEIHALRLDVKRRALRIERMEVDAAKMKTKLKAAADQRGDPNYPSTTTWSEREDQTPVDRRSPAALRWRPMPSLRTAIGDLASTFVAGVLDSIRGANLEDLLGEASIARRGPGRPKATPEGSTASARVTRSGRLKRRSREEIAKALDEVIALVKKHKSGLRAEQIRAQLKMDRKEMPRVLQEGLSTKKLKSKGQKRATTYTTAA